MTQPKYAQSDENVGRHYNFPDLPPLISVTTVVGVIHKPALTPWAAKLAGERAVLNEDTWHAMQKEEYEKLRDKWCKKNEGEPPYRELFLKASEHARKWVSAAPKEYNKYRMTFGSAVHWVCENRDNLDEEVMARLDWYLDKMAESKWPDAQDKAKQRSLVLAHLAQFEVFVTDHSPEFVMQEQTVANLTHGYAGTCDGVVEMGGKRYLFDIKTGGAYDTVALQLAAYRYAEYAVDGEGALSPLQMNVDGGFVLELKPKSYKVHFYNGDDKPDCGEEAFQAFLAAKRLKEWCDR